MEIILSIIGLVLSFFFAGSETAFISTHKIRLEIRIRRYFNSPEIFLSTTLIGNNFANIIATSYATVFLIRIWNEEFSWLVITLTILLFGEIIPKVFFRTYSDNIILKIIYPIRFFEFIFKPLVFTINTFISKVFRIIKLTKDNETLILSKEDVAVFIREAHIAGVVAKDEHKMISRILALPDIQVKEAKIPRTSIQAIDYNSSIKQLRTLMIKTGFTKIPIYKKEIDNIVGVVFMYDLFQNAKYIKDVIKPITYIPENKKCNILLHEFRNNNTSIAIVIDEYGGTSGLVTLKDLVEVLFGDFEESPEENMRRIIALNKVTWHIAGSELIENINEKINLQIPYGNYDTIAGLIISELGYIPKTGEKVFFKDFYINIIKATNKKIEEVRLVKNR